jgi:tripartite-type tricarboxylate transporter receptor subunit TctC
MKKYFSVALAGMLALLFVGCGDKPSGSATAEKEVYPQRPIELVIPFGEGGASDIFARKFSEFMSKKLPQPVQPINKKGSGGLKGLIYAASQNNDGYTVLEITPSHVIADVMDKSPEVKLLRDFEPLTRIQSDIYILGVPKNSKFNSFTELVEYGKTNIVTFAGISPGGLDDMTLTALADATGIKIRFIPYKSGSEVKAAVLGGEVDIYLDKVISAINYIKDGSIKPILVLNDKRIVQIDEFKEVPSSVELGYDVTIGSWRGFVIKKGVPEDIKVKLIKTMNEVYNSKEYQDFAALNLVNIREGFLDAEAFKADLNKQYKIFDAIAKKVGLK